MTMATTCKNSCRRSAEVVDVHQSPGGPPLTGVQALALGSAHSCARMGGGEIRCWGLNNAGQLGDGTTISWPTPVAILQAPGGPPLTDVQALALGAWHSCARLSDGDVRCWGHNDFGQLGNGMIATEPPLGALTPVAVLQSPGGPPLTGALALALGSAHSCALLGGGDVRCWGYNSSGQLGNGTTVTQPTPVAVVQAPGGPPLTGAQALALGYGHSCARLSDGDLHCWGHNDFGQLGDGTTTDRLTPVAVLQAPGGPPLTDVQALALGGEHSCALLGGSDVRCWGRNSLGQLGDGTTINQLTPVVVGLPDMP
ncbi:MAG TPA: hypothetical protein VFS43_46915 [Polyangiaceae bacterium]|nr:hypothetical protein [Polyangiaceae bacterium]